MKRTSKIGLALLSVLGVGLAYARLKTPELEQQSTDDLGDLENDTNEDSYFDGYSKEQEQLDLKKWGTQQGVIDVAPKTKRPVIRPRKFKTAGDTLGYQHRNLFRVKSLPKPQSPYFKRWYKWLRREFKCLQVTLTNNTNIEREITLWGNDGATSVSPSLATDVEDYELHETIDLIDSKGTANHPQGVIANPVNGLIYVANQLGNSVSIFQSSGVLVATVDLEPDVLPGSNSPVEFAVNTIASSPHYGEVYVAGLVANTISVIDLTHTVVATIAVGNRPLGLAVNPVNGNLYATNLADQTVSVIDIAARVEISTFPAGLLPEGIAVDPVTGEIYVANRGNNNVLIYSPSHVLQATLNAAAAGTTRIVYNPTNQTFYVTGSTSNEVYPIVSGSYTLGPPIPVGAQPIQIAYNHHNGYVFVGNRVDETYTVIAPDNTVRATLTLGTINIGFAFATNEHVMVSSQTATDQVQFFRFPEHSSNVTVNPMYWQWAEHFKQAPAMVKHGKFVLSGAYRFNLLKLLYRGVTGKQTIRQLAHRQYQSPQQTLNVSEFFDLNGEIIDHKNSWRFTIGPNQQIAVLVYYRQVLPQDNLPSSKTINQTINL